MLVTRKSMFTGIERTLDLPITEEQVQRYRAGAYIQDAFPQLKAADREFIKTGVTEEEWDAAFGADE